MIALRIFLSAFAFFYIFNLIQILPAQDLKSPDGKIEASIKVKNIGEKKGCLVYSITFQGRTVLAESRLGLELKEGSLAGEFKVVGEKDSSNDSIWSNPWGERLKVRDRYNQKIIDLETSGNTPKRLQLVIRVYNEGVAFCYTLPEQAGLKNFTITKELTQFAFTDNHTAWAVYNAQGFYDLEEPRVVAKKLGTGAVTLSQVKAGAERPLTVKIADDLYASVSEAKLVDYARMKLRLTSGEKYTLEAFLDAERGVDGTIVGLAPFSSPWRVIMIAESPAKLLEQNDIILNLNDPCAIADTSWIKPGKVIREGSLTTVGGKKSVDFAVQKNLQYIEYDAGWYGYEYDPNADAREVKLDPKRNPNPDSLNLKEVIEYANSKGVGVILYVNQIALEKQIDEILPLYQKWGVKGVKFGFVKVGSQQSTAWLHEAIRKAADHKLVVDIHDEFRSTGYQRTYPNLLTVEGIAGNEEFPTAVHNAALPFTRFLTGPGDYTYCWSDKRLKVSKAHQLALSTINFSPLQFLFWYEGPSSKLVEEAALDYWKNMPTTWDDTKVLDGDIGKTAVVARQKGNEWFLGAIAPVNGKIKIPMNFLPQGKKFKAQLYSDTDDLKVVKIEELQFDSTSTYEVNIPTHGGLAIHLVPVP